MSGDKLIGEEGVRIDGEWRVVRVYANVAALAQNMAPKAAKSKTQTAKARFGGIVVRVMPK